MSKAQKTDNKPPAQSASACVPSDWGESECRMAPNALDTRGQSSAEQVDESPSSPQDEGVNQQMLAALSNLDTKLASLNRTVENRLRYDKVKEAAFERLYVELDDLKRNAAFEQLRPLYVGLILLFDRIENISQETEPLSEVLQTLSDELLELLHRQEIEPIRATQCAFDPSVQQAIGIELTDVEDENNQVARVVRKGFRYRNRILRAEEVIVKKYRSPNGSAPTPEVQDESSIETLQN
jgi:molecular chaperone GrpE